MPRRFLITIKPPKKKKRRFAMRDGKVLRFRTLTAARKEVKAISDVKLNPRISKEKR